MSAFIKENKNAFVLENNHVKIEISKKDAQLLSLTEKIGGKSIMGETVRFFYLSDNEGNAYETKSLEYKDGTFTLDTEKGSVL